MEKKLYAVKFEDNDENYQTFYMKLTESERDLLEWLDKENLIFYFSCDLIDELPFIEF